MQGELPEPKYGLRLKPRALLRHEGRELAVVTCFSDDKKEGEIVEYFIDYREEDRDKTHALIELSEPPSDLPEPEWEPPMIRVMRRLPDAPKKPSRDGRGKMRWKIEKKPAKKKSSH